MAGNVQCCIYRQHGSTQYQTDMFQPWFGEFACLKSFVSIAELGSGHHKAEFTPGQHVAMLPDNILQHVALV